MKTKSIFLALTALLACYSGVWGQNQQKKKPQQTQQSQKPQSPKMPIEYFAKYNLWEDEFAKAHRTDQCSYYSLDEALQVCPDGYHLPTQEEWAGIFPYCKDNLDDKEGVESVTINGITKDYFAEYKDNYAIRFKRDPDMQFDNKMLTAFRYDVIGTDSTIRLKVTCRYLGEAFKGTIDDIANESFWASNNKNDVVREFPMAGMLFSWGEKYDVNKGYYWTASAPPTNYYYRRPRFVQNSCIEVWAKDRTTGYDDSQNRHCVRCIEDKKEAAKKSRAK